MRNCADVARCAALSLMLAASAPLAAQTEHAPPKSRVTFDPHSLMIDGKRTMIWSSEFHPFRLPSPSLWRDILEKMKASGFNTVAIYFDWGYHSPQPGIYDFTGIRDVDRVLDMARDAGLYVITRAGPYVNAELARGGYPGWMTRQAAHARGDDPEYLAATDEWMSQIDPIIARHQIDTGKGTVILHQIENELSITGPSEQRYIRHLYDRARSDGITVPIFHNDQGREGRWVPKGSGVAGVVEGPNDLYAFDGYPGGSCDVQGQPKPNPPAPDWGLWGSGGARGGASASPRTPGFLAEFGGGWFDYWGSNGSYGCNAVMLGKGYQRTFYGTNLINGISIQSFYIGYGGTSWGWMPAPVVYTSYDYGAAIAEDRAIRPKALELRQLGAFVTSIADLAHLEKGAPVQVSAPGVRVYRDVNPDTHAQLLFAKHQPSNLDGNDSFTIEADLPDGRYRMPQEGQIALHGPDAKLLLAGVDLGRQRLVYATSEVQTVLRRADDDVLLLYGRVGEPGETVLRFATQPRVTVLAGAVRSSWDAARHDLRLDYKHRGLIRIRIDGGGRPPALLLIGEDAEAQRFFREDAALVRGPSLVRTVRSKGGVLRLAGDTDAAEPLEVWPASPVRRVVWNGAAVPIAASASGSLVARVTLPGPRALALPDLTKARWAYAEGTPEARADFDDSGWQKVGEGVDNATIKAPVGQPVLHMDAYRFHQGDVWYRGRFHGSADARQITLHYGGGGAGMLQLWLDGQFIGQHELPSGLASPITTGVADFTLPADAFEGEHVLAVMVRNDGNNWDLFADDAHKEPRGLISASLGQPGGRSFAVPIAWTIQGTAGGEMLKDVARGPLNLGGSYGERMGWYLPGFPDAGWQVRTVPDATPITGTAWYRTGVDLAVPEGDDATIGVQIGDPTSPRSPGRYRVLIFVNGWNMGQFIANVGPQRVFPVPEGILNHRGHNILALAVTGDGSAGSALEPVKLVTMRHVRGGVPVSMVPAPDYRTVFKQQR